MRWEYAVGRSCYGIGSPRRPREAMRTFTFNFQPRFAEEVAAGRKRQTIRADRKDNKLPAIGDIVSLYRGLRTRGVQLLVKGDVTERLAVRMHFDFNKIVVGGKLLRGAELEDFAKADGFLCSSEMLNWFKCQYGGSDFSGFCVRWTPRLSGGNGCHANRLAFCSVADADWQAVSFSADLAQLEQAQLPATFNRVGEAVKWSCSNFVHHEHRWRWTAWVCGRAQLLWHWLTT